MFAIGLTTDQCVAVYTAIQLVLDDDDTRENLDAQDYEQLISLKQLIENKFPDFVLKNGLTEPK